MERVSRGLLSRTKLSPEAMRAALDLARLRPDPSEWREFAVRAMGLAGVLSLAAGMVFLVAFNWRHLGIYGRFAMVQAPLLAALLVAWVKGLDRLSGKLALTLAVFLTGALLALFGQTYQTGADVYELFLGWAVLALPWVIACRYAPCWALWLLLANAAMSLYVGTSGRGWLFEMFHRWQWSPWALPFLLNLLLYGTIASLSRWPGSGLTEAWLRRGVMALAMAFGTFAMVYRISDGPSRGAEGAAVLEVFLYLVASGAFAAHAYSQREDLFNFAVLALSAIVVTTTLIGRAMLEDRAGIGALFVIALYVIGASTAAVKGISHLGRQWKVEEPAK
jgi:uncharacterized membrane protein